MARNNEQQNAYLDIAVLCEEIGKEVWAARDKFPSPDMVLAALMEEVGELAQAIMERQRNHDMLLAVAKDQNVKSISSADGDRIRKWTRENIRKEAIQVAAMAVRIALEGDPRFPSSQTFDL